MLGIFKYFKRKDWALVVISFGFIISGVWFDLKLPEYLANITTLVQTLGSTMQDIWIAGAMMILCTLGSLVSAIIVGFLSAIIGASFSKNLRSVLFNKVESFSMEEINKFSTASLITRTTNDITQVQMLIVMGLQLIVKAPITATWAIIKITGKGYGWTLSTGIAVLIMVVVMSLMIILVMSKFKKMQRLTDNMNRVTRENLTGLRVVRAYNAEDHQEKKFADANEELTETHLYVTRATAFLNPILMFIMSSLSLAIYFIGAHLINKADLTLNAAGVPEKLVIFSNMVVFSQYAGQIVGAFILLTMIFMLYPRASVSARRINEVLEADFTIIDGNRTEGLSGVKGEVSFTNVSFKYPGTVDYVLRDISFTVKQGETIAFIGSTGSGKSTLVNLIPRFFDTTEGKIFVDGLNIREYTLESLRNKIGYVPQKSVLFTGTVSSNIGYGDNGSDCFSESDIKDAIRIAQATDFVEAMEGEYQAKIAQGGTNVSGGQKQRLSIARAVCRKPEFYIFDDSFSALDYKTDRALRTMLKEETAEVTTIIVAQRIGTIIDADQIIVLDEGRVVGHGQHKELLQKCEVYREIARGQLSEEELAS